MQPRKERKPPPETNMANILERARKSCLALPDDLVWPEPEPGRNLVIEDVSLGEDREDEERVSHMLIESDNIHALGLLRETHRQKVDLIYIDPPYNTGRLDLGYRDRWEPADWIRFMFPRLVLARDLLAPHGAIMISIDDNEVHRLKLLMDAIFGGPNRVVGMIWQCRTFMRSLISEDHEHVLVYSRHRADIVPYWSRKDEPTWFGKKVTRAYDNPDGDERGPWRDCKCKPPSGKVKKTGGNDYDYSINMGTGELRRGRVDGDEWIHRVDWEYVIGTMTTLLDERRIVWYRKKNGSPDYRVKRFAAEEPEISCLGSVMTEAQMMTARGKDDLLAIGVDPGDFKHAKPVKLIQHLIQVAAPDATILDFFAGTGTTGHAVMALNAADGGSRKAILVTSGENGICRRLTWPRLQAARNATGGTGDLIMARVDGGDGK